MGYGKLDELCINTIRTLAVCSPGDRDRRRGRLEFEELSEHDTARCRNIMADDSDSTGRCHLPGELGPPWCTHGDGTGGPRPIQQVHDLQSSESKLDKQRSFCPVEWPWVHAAVCTPSSVWLQGQHGRPQTLPSSRQHNTGASRIA